MDAYYLDAALVRRSFNAASRSFDTAAVLHSEVRQRMLDRLQLLKAEPEVIIDVGAGTGHASRALKRKFPHAQVIAFDSAFNMLHESRRQQSWWRRFARTAGDAHALPFRDGSVDWVISNLMLPWCASIDAVFAEVHRVLKPGGVFSFTSLGPDTLKELRQAWQPDEHTHVNAFIDMHDIGDALMRAHFAEPVLDVEYFTLTYQNVQQLMLDLKATGSGNVTSSRRRALTGRNRLSAMVAAYEQQRTAGKLPATFEVVYGQAWRSNIQPRPKDAGVTRISVESLRGTRRKNNKSN